MLEGIKDGRRLRPNGLVYSIRGQNVMSHFNYLCTYDLYSPVHNVLDACISIMKGSGRGLGPGIIEFFGPCEMASSR
jgi:hypothetical protein